MKRYRNKIAVLFIVSLTLTLKTSGKASILLGQTAEPTFNHRGELVYIYKNNEDKINLETLRPRPEEDIIKTLSLKENTFSPLIKKDQKEQIWITWEEWDQDQSIIFLGRLEDDKITSSHLVSDEQGFNLSPDLTFDLNDNPWIVWSNYKDGHYQIFVKEIMTKNTWLIYSGFFSSASSPKIIIDFSNRAWVFWSGKDNGEEEIFYRIFDQYTWSLTHRINQENEFPHLGPSISLAQNGFIWISWSGYDGQDYEIYCKFWDGKDWSKIQKITDNCQKNDISPSLAITSKEIPVVAWEQSEEKGSRVYLKYLEHGSWSREIKISDEKGLNASPKIVAEQERIGITWRSQDEVVARLFFFQQLSENNLPDEPPSQKQIIFNPTLDEDKYIGFGDSITYGYINFEPAPEKGYLPRLEILLDQNFGETEVINEGWPGEITLNGLGRIESVAADHLAQYLLLMEGTNDIVFSKISMDTTAFNLEQMVKKCIDFGVFAAIATIIPRKDRKWDNKFFRDRIFYLNEKIRELAQEFPIPMVDQFNLFYYYPEEDGGWKSLLSDYNHPTEEGYQLMAEEWFEEIKNFPFPPVNLQVDRVYNEILFYREPGNHLTWQDNPKIYDKSNIRGYKIYRKKTEEENDRFELLEIIYSRREYFDEDIITSVRYTYSVSTLRTDEMEGPCSKPENDQ